MTHAPMAATASMGSRRPVLKGHTSQLLLPVSFEPMRTFRAWLGSATVLALTLGTAVSAFSQVGTVHAAGSSLSISEINYVGAFAHFSDQWVELYNPTALPVNLAATPVTLKINGSVAATLSAGTIAPQGYYLIAREGMGADSSLALAPDMVVPSMELPFEDARYELVQTIAGLDTVVDVADDGSGEMMAGGFIANDTEFAVASMARVDFTIPGDSSTAWRTSGTIGGGLVPAVGRSEGNLYATPRSGAFTDLPNHVNRELVRPVNPAIAPAIIGGPNQNFTASLAAASDQDLSSVTSTLNIFDGTQVYTTGSGVGMGGSAVAYSTAYPTGVYRFQMGLVASNGDRTPFVQVSTGTTPGGLYAVNVTGATPEAPMVMAPEFTNQDSVDAFVAPTGPSNFVAAVRSGMPFSTEVISATYTPSAMGGWVLELPTPAYMDSVTYEVWSRGVDGNFSRPAMVTITRDDLAPMVNVSKLKVTSQAPGTEDMIQGLAGATEAGATVTVYGDSSRTTMLGMATAAADGSFSMVGIGDNRYDYVFVQATDAAGNMSGLVSAFNPINFRVNPAVAVKEITTSQAALSITPVTGAARYEYKLAQDSAAYGAVSSLSCPATGTCVLTAVLGNLKIGTFYTVSVTAYDMYGNASAPVTKSFMTLTAAQAAAATTGSGTGSSTPATAAVVTPVAAVVETTAVTASAPVATYVAPAATITTSPTPSPEATPTPTPTPTESGQVQAASTESPRSVTPWIVLGILVALAILASAAYFYWFGGDAGMAVEEASASAAGAGMAAGKKKDEEEKSTETKDPSEKKRW